ncbi:ThiF family adenylyltransferase [Streptomyces sp. NPDC002187]|uniref:ThiF family adenylyltransferase n=1 Tax=Streptomyces sp. NPDC002187 TaxID=3364637 RepID=UPI0036A78A76
MHPMMKPALRRAWRDRQSVQFGVTPAHAVTVGPVDTATGSLIELLDGTRGLPLLREQARTIGLPDGQVDALVARLATAGLVDDATAGGPAADALRTRAGALERLRPDLASLSVIHPEPGGGMGRLVARRAIRVQVRGAGRVGATVAATLSAAGVGRVEVLDGGCAEPGDVAPGGLPGEAVGERRAVAARQLVRRTAPDRPPRAAETGTAGTGEPGLSLIVVAPRDGLSAYAPDPAGAEDWIATGTPHLYAGVVEATGVVGPLVLPGCSACAECLERGRAERDPGRARLLAQWRSGRRRAAPPACDVALATTVAGLAAAHALSFLDGELPASVGARCEVSLPLLRWRSESVPPHLDCPCSAERKSERGRTLGFGPTHETMAGPSPSTV